MTRRVALQVLLAAPCAALLPAARATPPRSAPLGQCSCIIRRPIVGIDFWQGTDRRTGERIGGAIIRRAGDEVDDSVPDLGEAFEDALRDLA